ncbi:P-loop containing nucleoside triphosphate hydrolase protein [Aspergillus novofumigatus IBT 16806]|uniref:DNA 3'-5' helicase n=1 Tax=Aspergillus novofumigatus (strain IBT 16806) TaxID=1392255 RepID=A0A2I1BS96_ASPN1|nr:P-loop containing nucleoside triphosphate hydrolase protein [Aspergillus novofumigatus IBT 16806]PKX88226.1 P-loop containing nucleoside triphosphate hydrolase protein [Aspergillus novofumigatus IBT 16806]
MQFRGVQDPAMRAIQRGESPVVAVMPTGGGKSMLFMVPAFAAPGGTTIIVVPLVALRADMTRRCQELGISCTFLNRLRWTRRLDRIVIDECHVVLNSQHDFRPQMAQLGRLVQARTQMVWLTATLPPSMEAELCRWMKYDRAAVTIYRAWTSRLNVVYRVWRPDMTGVIIYANIIGQVTAMARVLGCEAYYSEQLDKAGVLARFMGASPVIAATSALGMGVDIPNIRSIIHIGTPRMLLDYA